MISIDLENDMDFLGNFKLIWLLNLCLLIPAHIIHRRELGDKLNETPEQTADLKIPQDYTTEPVQTVSEPSDKLISAIDAVVDKLNEVEIKNVVSYLNIINELSEEHEIKVKEDLAKINSESFPSGYMTENEEKLVESGLSSGYDDIFLTTEVSIIQNNLSKTKLTLESDIVNILRNLNNLATDDEKLIQAKLFNMNKEKESERIKKAINLETSVSTLNNYEEFIEKQNQNQSSKGEQKVVDVQQSFVSSVENVEAEKVDLNQANTTDQPKSEEIFTKESENENSPSKSQTTQTALLQTTPFIMFAKESENQLNMAITTDIAIISRQEKALGSQTIMKNESRTDSSMNQEETSPSTITPQTTTSNKVTNTSEKPVTVDISSNTVETIFNSTIRATRPTRPSRPTRPTRQTRPTRSTRRPIYSLPTRRPASEIPQLPLWLPNFFLIPPNQIFPTFFINPLNATTFNIHPNRSTFGIGILPIPLNWRPMNLTNFFSHNGTLQTQSSVRKESATIPSNNQFLQLYLPIKYPLNGQIIKENQSANVTSDTVPLTEEHNTKSNSEKGDENTSLMFQLKMPNPIIQLFNGFMQTFMPKQN